MLAAAASGARATVTVFVAVGNKPEVKVLSTAQFVDELLGQVIHELRLTAASSRRFYLHLCDEKYKSIRRLDCASSLEDAGVAHRARLRIEAYEDGEHTRLQPRHGSSMRKQCALLTFLSHFCACACRSCRCRRLCSQLRLVRCG